MKLVEKIGKSSISIVASLFLLASILSCGGKQGNHNTPQPTETDPSLKLKELKYADKVVEKPYEITVKSDVETLLPTDFKAKFDYGSTTDAEIPIDNVVLPKGQSKLIDGKNIVLLKVKGNKGVYSSTSIRITVTKGTQGNTSHKVTFAVLPAGQGAIAANLEGKTSVVESNKTLVEKDKVVELTLTIKDPNTYVLDGWNCADADVKVSTSQALKASFIMPGKETTVTARLRKKDEAPSLNLKELRYSSKKLEKPYSISLANDIKTISKDDFEGIFDYGDQTDQPIPFDSLELENKATELKVGENVVTLKVNDKPSTYKGCSVKVKVIRMEPELLLQTLTYKGKDCTNGINVANSVKTISKDDFEGWFDYGDQTNQKIPFDSLELENNATELKVGNNIVILKINGKDGKYADFETRCHVQRNGVGSFTVKIKRVEDAAPIEVQDNATLKTSHNETEVSVLSLAKMTKVMIAGKPATLNLEKTEATMKVGFGSVEVKVSFAEYADASLTFTLEKLSSGELLPISCVSAVLEGTKNHTLQFNAQNVASWDAEKGDIEYSSVKLTMNMDATLTGRGVQCKDERSNKYSTDPTENDLQGICSGYVVREIQDNHVTYCHPINEKEYSERFIVGAGKVEYAITFTADNRKPTTYTIKINNKNKEKFKPEDHDSNLLVFGGGGRGLRFFERFIPLPYYHAGPFLKDDNYNFEPFPNLGVMGTLNLEIQKRSESTNDVEKEARIYFYSTVYDANDDSKKHEFTMYGDNFFANSDIVQHYIQISEDVAGKYFDGFTAFKNYLPTQICPLYTQKKWERLAEDGVSMKIIQATAPGNFDTNKGCDELCNYRNSAFYAKKVQALGEANSTEKLRFYKKMTFKNWVLGEIQNTEDHPVLTNNDAMAVFLEFHPASDFKAIFNILKGDDESNLTVDPACSNAEALYLSNQDKTLRLVIPGVAPGKAVNIKDDSYKFQDGNIYQVEVKITNNGKTNKYIYVLDYKDETSHEIKTMSVQNLPSSNIFGVPTSYNAIHSYNERMSNLHSNTTILKAN